MEIPKLKILIVGTVLDGKPSGWRFDGMSLPNSVSYYIDNEAELWGGYNINELKDISNGALNPEEHY